MLGWIIWLKVDVKPRTALFLDWSVPLRWEFGSESYILIYFYSTNLILLTWGSLDYCLDFSTEAYLYCRGTIGIGIGCAG